MLKALLFYVILSFIYFKLTHKDELKSYSLRDKKDVENEILSSDENMAFNSDYRTQWR